ncbi:conserved hypothetical protein [Sphingomonas aurantiaca]|uniref:Uncharacterized protein n=1 Tax=Sphingomonas aurantiaca TaxID=185949 RepID=A0A5E7XPL1_9SPHN|nr:conserved hypothetical protein [Sphingomonas aurantiaca]
MRSCKRPTMMKSIAKLIVWLDDVTQTLSIAYPFLDGGSDRHAVAQEAPSARQPFP